MIVSLYYSDDPVMCSLRACLSREVFLKLWFLSVTSMKCSSKNLKKNVFLDAWGVSDSFEICNIVFQGAAHLFYMFAERGI